MLVLPVSVTHASANSTHVGRDQLQSSVKRLALNDGEEKEERDSLPILHGQEFFNRLLEKETSITYRDSGRINYRAPGAIPFDWEAEPGKPKDPLGEQQMPPLSLPPIRRAKHSSSSSSDLIPHTPRSLTGKLKRLWNGKISSSQRLGSRGSTLGLHSYHNDPSCNSTRSFQSRLKKSSSVGSELMGRHQKSTTVLEKKSVLKKNFGSKSQVVRGGNKLSILKTMLRDNKNIRPDENPSPRSTLDYNSDRSSSSSPFCFSPSFKKDLPSFSPSSSLGQKSGSKFSSSASNIPSSTVARSILADWSRSLSTFPDPDARVLSDCSFPLAKSTTLTSHSGPQSYCGSSPISKCHSGPQPHILRSNYAATQRMYSGHARFYSGPQKALVSSQKSFSSKNHLALKDPTCSALEQLFPLKSVPTSLFMQTRQKSSDMNGKLEERKHNVNKTVMESRKVESTADAGQDATAANISAFSPVTSAFVFAHYGELSASDRQLSSLVSLPTEQISSSSREIFPMQLQVTTGAQCELDSEASSCNVGSSGSISPLVSFADNSHSREIFPMPVATRTAAHNESAESSSSPSTSSKGDLKSGSTGSFSSPEIAAFHPATEKNSVQSHAIARVVGSQKISTVLLRQVAQVEKELRKQRHKSRIWNITGPSCLPVCTFFERSILCRNKVVSQRHFLEYDV